MMKKHGKNPSTSLSNKTVRAKTLAAFDDDTYESKNSAHGTTKP